jgi:hypothetical protein
VSRDLDLFHDTAEALDAAWRDDRAALEAAGCGVAVLRDRAGLVEAQVGRGPDEVVIQWTRDSAYRFFPLLEHEELGLTLHPLAALASDELLAVAGRSEPRDLVDALACHEGLQPLGYLAWAACGKDPGFSPRAILEHAAGSTRYAGPELAGLAFEGAPPPDPADLLRRWRVALRSAPEVVDRLPPEHAGKAVLDREGRLFRGEPAELEAALASEGLVFHEGAIRGAFPRLVR